MRADVSAYPAAGSKRDVSVHLWLDTTVADLLNGTQTETPTDYGGIATTIRMDNTWPITATGLPRSRNCCRRGRISRA